MAKTRFLYGSTYQQRKDAYADFYEIYLCHFLVLHGLLQASAFVLSFTFGKCAFTLELLSLGIIPVALFVRECQKQIGLSLADTWLCPLYRTWEFFPDPQPNSTLHSPPDSTTRDKPDGEKLFLTLHISLENAQRHTSQGETGSPSQR